MKIRKAENADKNDLAKIIKQSFATVAQRYNLTPDNCPRHPSNYTEEWVEKDIEQGVVYFVIEENGNKIGCIALEKANEETCYLERLAVLPEKRNKGIGQKLVTYFISEAIGQGFKNIGIGIIEKQIELKNWYKKIGFYETGKKSFDHLPFEVCFMQYKSNEK
ncbi:MAG: GNAT family N-acetyltransferase [Desulfobacteraceae bacterium]|jgi:N-acetylglutamate synthase-like GNAT family acetyltransferase